MSRKKVDSVIHADGVDISVMTTVGNEEDFISLTDMARRRNPEFPADVVKNWMRLRSTIEFLGLWEQLNNPNFKLVEFDQFKNEAGANSRIHTDAIKENLLPPELPRNKQGYVYADEADVLNVALFGITAKQWRQQNPEKKGNIRDYATVEQLLVLTNLENMNAYLIEHEISQEERLRELHHIAVTQMEKLISNNSSVDKLSALEAQAALPGT